jgi:hypothetical protein
MEDRLMSKFPDFERQLHMMKDDFMNLKNHQSGHTWDINDIKAQLF